MQFERRRTALLQEPFLSSRAASQYLPTHILRGPWRTALRRNGGQLAPQTIFMVTCAGASQVSPRRREEPVSSSAGKHFELPRVLFKRHGRRCSGRPRRWQAARTPTNWPLTHSARSGAMSEIVRRKEVRAFHHWQNRNILNEAMQ